MARWSAERRAEVEAAIRHGAANGLTWRQVGGQVGLSVNHVRVRAFRLGVPAAHRYLQPDAGLRQAIRDGYADGKSAREIAETAGSTRRSVLALACKMGVTSAEHHRASIRAYWCSVRGYDIPDDMRSEYERLTHRKHLTMREAGLALGLLKEKKQEEST